MREEVLRRMRDRCGYCKKAASMEGVDFLCFRMEGGDPNGANKSTEELVGMLKEIVAAVDLPLVVAGCKHVEKDAELLAKAAEAVDGKECRTPCSKRRELQDRRCSSRPGLQTESWELSPQWISTWQSS